MTAGFLELKCSRRADAWRGDEERCISADAVRGALGVQEDRVQLQQVILNLIINAVEAMSSMREGARELLICTDKAESNGVLVAVRDSGPGLTPETLEHVFEASYATKASGLGLGLWICRSIVEAHGGRLWATANGACGGLFQFIFPNAEKGLMNAPHARYQTEELHECTAINASYQLACQSNERQHQSEPQQSRPLRLLSH
jgi:signal transduction histidine kinase